MENAVELYLSYCRDQRMLAKKTLSAYACDLGDFVRMLAEFEPPVTHPNCVSRQELEQYLSCLTGQYKVRSVKRKIASVRGFFTYLEEHELIDAHPFQKFRLRLREESRLPKSLSIQEVAQLPRYMYGSAPGNPDSHRYFLWLRDTAVLELLFATGMRVAELCSLRLCDYDEAADTLTVIGKGDKQRSVPLVNEDAKAILLQYLAARGRWVQDCDIIFLSRSGRPMPTQAVRELVTKHTKAAGLPEGITPHSFRHSFATLLLEEGVDIRYIQDFLGHSSISTTQIYLRVTDARKRAILGTMHPREKMSL